MRHLNRRRFLCNAALGVSAMAGSGAFCAVTKPVLAGVQISPHSLLDEGVERCLDFLQEHAAINALFCYSQTYHMGTRPLNVLASDHPTPPRKLDGRNLPHQWVRLPGAEFKGLAVGHERADPGREYAARDIFAELAEPCRRRGIRLYARILEAGMRRAARIPGYSRVGTVDLDGEPGQGPCWNHPEYREWVRITVRQTMMRYPLDGLQYGAERVGPLSDVLFRGEKPECFCEHCRDRNGKAGIDADRAQEGYRQLHRLMRGLAEGGAKPADGVFAAVLRVLMKYPEVLAWYEQWFRADSEIQAMVYREAKALRPEADVGQHVDHQRSSWDIFYRASVSYADMAAHNDFVKPILYHDILGPRLREWVIDRMQRRVLGDLSKELSLDLFYAVFGHDRATQPSYAVLPKRGLSPEYVFRETRRCVAGVAGGARVYAGIGFDVPQYVPSGMEPFPSDPATTALATRRALEAGAAGVVASREYDEMSLPNLKAFGRAVSAGQR
ncbi:MAG: hypothetical protein ISQ14_14425 [Verrucomicrobiae bacterium]|jgi:hypothetical protein|nr:hypothetical protein [Verrucomicrobiae bacterium]